jgi:hypothetical protein
VRRLGRGGLLEVLAWVLLGVGLIGASRFNGTISYVSYYVAGIGLALLALVYLVTVITRNRSEAEG